MLICSVAALLAASGTQSANAIQGGNQDADAQYNLACAGAGIEPGNPAFSRCVADLHYSLWAVENLYKS